VKEALSSATCVIFETDFLSKDSVMTIINRNKFTKDSLSSGLTPRQVDTLRSVLLAYGMKLENIENVSPYILSTQIIRQSISKNCEVIGVDGEVFKLVDSTQKLLYLETLDEHIKLLIKGVTREYLLTYLLNREQYNSNLDNLVISYKNGNISDIHRSLLSSKDSAHCSFNHIMINERNSKWLYKIMEISSSNNSFFAVGAGHLYGNNGLINLLRKKGYKVTPVY
jgi:uncharacterized protein YbaP (TraB family)